METVTGGIYEQAVADLVFTQLGLEHSYFVPSEVMTRRFAVGHPQQPDGAVLPPAARSVPARTGTPAL